MTTKVDAPQLLQTIEPRFSNAPRIYVYASSRAGHGPYRVVAFKGRYDCPCSGAAGAAKAARAGRVTKSGGECRHKKDARQREEARAWRDAPEVNGVKTLEASFLDEGNEMTNKTETGREVTVGGHDQHVMSSPGQATRSNHAMALSTGVVLPTPEKFDMMMRIAGTVAKAGSGADSMVPQNIKTPEAALAIMLAGDELGFPPFAALRQVFLVNGKTEIMTEGKLALMRQRDPSLRIEWHRGARRGLLEDGMRGAEATLWRNGEPMCRIRYDEEDKARAHQGQKRGGPRKWIPDLEPDGKTQKKHPAGHPKAGEGKVKINPQYDENATGGYEDDPESPWTKYEPDMYEWAVIKRLERYGASDLVNLAPMQIVEAMPGAWTVEEDQAIPLAPRTALESAIIRGELEPARVAAETTPPEGEGDPDEPPIFDDDEEDEDPAEVDTNAPTETGEDTPAPDASNVLDIAFEDLAAEPPSAAPEMTAEDLEAVTNAARQKLYDEAIRIQKGGTLSPTDYGALIRRLGAKYTPDTGRFSTTALTLEQAREALAELLEGAGEAGPPAEATS